MMNVVIAAIKPNKPWDGKVVNHKNDWLDIHDLIIEKKYADRLRDAGEHLWQEALKSGWINEELVINMIESPNFGYIVTSTKIYRY